MRFPIVVFAVVLVCAGSSLMVAQQDGGTPRQGGAGPLGGGGGRGGQRGGARGRGDFDFAGTADEDSRFKAPPRFADS